MTEAGDEEKVNHAVRTTAGQKAFGELLHGAEERLRVAWAQADAVRHRPSKGRAREHPVRVFLGGQLPDRFGFLSGEAIDFYGNRTPQLDLIVYDRMRVGPFFAAGEDGLIPAEAILATIEVKSVVNRDAMDQFTKSVAELHRLRPYKNSFVFARPGGAKDDGAPRVQSTLFGYGSDLREEGWARSELERARECISENACPVRGVDRIVVLDRGVILPAEGEAIIKSAQTGVLRTWFFHLVNFLTREAERRRAFPWSAYADPTEDESRVELAVPLAPGRADPQRQGVARGRSGHRPAGQSQRKRGRKKGGGRGRRNTKGKGR